MNPMSKRWVYLIPDMSKHEWAFYYFCKRRGDRVWIDQRIQTANIQVRS